MAAKETTVNIESTGKTAALIDRVSKRTFAGLPPVVANILITVFLALFEEYFVEFNFRCPCVDASDCKVYSSLKIETRKYGRIAVIVTTLSVFVLGFLALATLKYERKKNSCTFKHGMQTGDICFWFAEAIFLTFVWLTILLIDGDYMACIKTCSAYGDPCSEVDAKDKAHSPFSESYMRNKENSTDSGYILGFFLVLAYGLTKIFHNDSSCGFHENWWKRGMFEHWFCCKCITESCQYDKNLRPRDKGKIDREVEEASMKLRERLPSELNRISQGIISTHNELFDESSELDAAESGDRYQALQQGREQSSGSHSSTVLDEGETVHLIST